MPSNVAQKHHASGSKFPIRFEKVFSRLDKDLPPRGTGWRGRLMARALQRFGRKLEKDSVRQAIKELRSAGCEKTELLWRLLPCSLDLVQDYLNESLKVAPRDLRAIAKRLRGSGVKLSRVQGAQFGLSGLHPPMDFYFSKLSRRIQDWADVLECLFRCFRPHKGSFPQLFPARLVHYVYKRTTKYHDKEVAILRGAVSEGDKYMDSDHRAWRHAIYDQLLLKQPATLSEFARGEMENCLEAAMAQH